MIFYYFCRNIAKNVKTCRYIKLLIPCFYLPNHHTVINI